MVTEEIRSHVMYSKEMERIKSNSIIAVSITNKSVAIKFESVAQASRFFISRGTDETRAEHIQECLDGTLSSYLGFTWHYAEDRERKTRYNSERIQCTGRTGKEDYHGMIFDSLAQAELITGVARTNICDCCRGKRKSAGGYKWSYVDKIAD